MEKQFDKKVAIVTGGCFGIGRATAIAFAKRGAKVAIADMVEDGETINLIKSVGGGEVFYIKCDVSKDQDVKMMVEKTVSTFGKIDYAFNNAGTEGASTLLHECTEENWERTIGVNLKGIWLCLKYEIQQMLKQKKGVIVNNASIAGLVAFRKLPAYIASKHGVVGLTKAAALETARFGIRINAVCPAAIKTSMIDRFMGQKKEIEQKIINKMPLKRMGRPEEVAEAAIWLCSDASSFVTGHAMTVDGGWTAQ